MPEDLTAEQRARVLTAAARSLECAAHLELLDGAVSRLVIDSEIYSAKRILELHPHGTKVLNI